MHVAFLLPTIDRIGGAERQVLLLAQGLADRNWKVSVIALSGTGGNSAAQLRSHGIAFCSLRMRKGLADPRGWLRLYRWLRRHQPSILHTHLPHAALMARFSRLIAPIRVLVETIHSPAIGSLSRRVAYRFSASQTDAIAGVSCAAAEPWLAARMLNDASLTIIPNGIDLNHWKRDPELRHATRKNLSLGDEFVWLAIGRLDPVKDHATLLRAFAKAPGKARLFIAGTGSLESALRSQAALLGIENNVHFLGFQSDVLSWMQAADGYVLSSRWEGLPMAFLEASACELPAVFTDIPAMREFFRDRYDRPVIPVGDSDALAAAMNAMMGLPDDERRKLGTAARELLTRRFSLASVLDQWENAYRLLLAAKPHPTRSGIAASVLRGSTLQLQ